MFNAWFRFSRYELSGRFLQPARDATLETYDPWKEYEESSVTGRGGRLLTRPYLSLIDISDGRDPASLRGKDLFFHSSERLTDWCSRHGLLGLFPQEVRQVKLYPRWQASSQRRQSAPAGHRSQMAPPVYAGRRILMQTPTGWLAREDAAINAEALTAPAEQQPIGSLVPKELWDPHWGQPEVLLQDAVSGEFYRQKASETFADFFPSIPDPDRETLSCPVPGSPEFWRLYAEDRDQFTRAVMSFAAMVRRLGRPIDASNFADREEVQTALSELQRWAGPTYFTLRLGSAGGFVPGRMISSLLSAFAAMALLDVAQGLLGVCANCDRVFVSSAGRAKYCSPRCRRTSIQRDWRARTAEAKRS